jgi:hypothetical protein
LEEQIWRPSSLGIARKIVQQHLHDHSLLPKSTMEDETWIASDPHPEKTGFVKSKKGKRKKSNLFHQSQNHFHMSIFSRQNQRSSINGILQAERKS